MEHNEASKDASAGMPPVNASSGNTGLYEFNFEDINTEDVGERGTVPANEPEIDPLQEEEERLQAEEKRQKKLHFRRRIRQSNKVLTGLFTWIKDLAIVFAIIYLIINFLAAFVKIEDTNMAPTLNEGETVMAIRFSYKWAKPGRGEVVCVKDPEDGKMHIARIVGLPGDKIVIDGDGFVYINDLLFETSYFKDKTRYVPRQMTYPYTVPEGEYFLLSDDPNSTWDSRYRAVSGVKLEDIVGKVFGVVWPRPSWRPLY